MENLTEDEVRQAQQCSNSPRSLAQPPPEISAALNVIGGKWKILILWQLLRQTCRFNQLRKAIPGISQHMLTADLRDLELEGVVTRRIYAEVPPRVEYSLTSHGKNLGLVMRALSEWGSSHVGRDEREKQAAVDKR